MKTIYLICALSIAWAQIAQASSSPESLYKEWKRQQNWEDVQIQVEGLGKPIQGTLTEKKSLRLADFSGVMPTQGRLQSMTWDGLQTQAQFKEYCQLTADDVSARSELETPFVLEFPIVPMKNGAYLVTRQNGSKQYIVGVENKFRPFEWFKVQVVSKPGSITEKTLRSDQRQILESGIASQLEDLRSTMAATATMSIDLTHYTDVACDLVHNQVEIRVETVVHYDAARLNREQFIPDEAITSVYQELRERSRRISNSKDIRLMSAAYLGLAIEHAGLNLDIFRPDEFARLFNLFHNPSNGQTYQLAASDLVEVSQAMTRLEQKQSWSMTTYVPTVEAGE